MTSPSAEILILATDHLAGWDGSDGTEDILSSRRQSELEDLIELLARFESSKVCVEVLASKQSDLNDIYASYLTGKAAPERDETEQIGFRLAQKLGHTQVFATDANWTLDWSTVKEYLERHPEDEPSVALSAESQKLIGEANLLRNSMTITQMLAHVNSSELLSLNDREYLDRYLLIGSGDNWGGVDLVASWYRRNLRILANLLKLAEPGDRLVQVIGRGHAASLRHFTSISGRLNLVQPVEYLT